MFTTSPNLWSLGGDTYSGTTEKECTPRADRPARPALAFEVTKASTGEQPQAQRLLDQMQERHPELLERCGRMSADKGYDDHKLINRLWQQHQFKPIIAVRDCWQDGEHEEDGVVTKRVSSQENVIYTFDGQVSCVCPQTGNEHRMA